MTMLKKFLMLFFVLVLVSACSSTHDNMMVEENYDVIETQAQADMMNMENTVIEEIHVPDRVYFSLNKYNISTESAAVLKLQAEWLKADTSLDVIVEGHCDDRGTREYNLALGKKRAESVKNYLVAQGVSSSRISTLSYGKEKPLVLGSGESVWAKNRASVTVVAE